MKDVMWRRGHGEDLPGGLELRQKGRTNFIPMFDTHGEIKEEILDALRVAPVRVSSLLPRMDYVAHRYAMRSSLSRSPFGT